MPKTDGPIVRITGSCFECRHETSESYAVQGDSGHDVYCTHPVVAESLEAKAGRRRIGDSVWATPKWCPLLRAAILKTFAEMET